MNDNKVISSEKVIIETPPDENTLKTYSVERLISECNRLNIPREQYEASNDSDKNKKFMMNEILRLEPPFPRSQKPVIVDSVYDESTMTKINILKYVKHIITDGNYQYSVITTESYMSPLTKREINIQNKNKLLNSIRDEISNLNLDEFKNKEDILKFACNNSKSNGEKYRRASLLSDSVIKHMRGNDKYIRPRITHFDISVY
jgi:hypothetical protein